MEIDFLILFIIVLSILLEIKGGFINALKDILIAGASIIFGIISYYLTFNLFQSFKIGIIVFLSSAFAFLFLFIRLWKKKGDREAQLRGGRQLPGQLLQYPFTTLLSILLGIGVSLAVLIILSFFFPERIQAPRGALRLRG